jgi:hypothetical protein
LLLYPYIAIVGDLAPQVDFLSSIKMTPLAPIQHPYISDLMASIKVIGKLVVEPKTLGMGTLSGRISKMLSKTLE